MSNLEYEVRDLLARGKKIEAVKLVVQKTGKGLKESKNYVDSLSQNQPAESYISTETLEFEARLLLDKGKKVNAVKKVRELTGWGLKEAKDFVDSL